MFKINPKWFVIGLLFVCGLLYWDHTKTQLAEYRALSDAQAQTITMQSKTISQLNADAERNRKLTLEISKAESEARSKADEVIKHIPPQITNSDAYNADAPRGVVEFLRE